jgi:hypothetical protein
MSLAIFFSWIFIHSNTPLVTAFISFNTEVCMKCSNCSYVSEQFQLILEHKNDSCKRLLLFPT